MTVLYSINKIENGFTISTKADANEVATLQIPSYELSRNLIKAERVRGVKHYNIGFGDVNIQAESDNAFFPNMRGGMQPLTIGRGDLKITALFSVISNRTFTFIYDPAGYYMTNLYQAQPPVVPV